MHQFHSRILFSILPFAVFALFSCRAIESVDKVEKSTAEVGEKMDKTNDGIDRTNRKMDETNGSIDETNKKMDDVRRQMNDMNNKLVETNQRMETMNRALDRMYQDLRQGDALNARLKTIEKMEETPHLVGKTVYAAQYFMSFEYQLWKGIGFDDPEMQLVLKRSAVDEFVQILRRLVQKDFPVDALDDSNDVASAKALALSMHMLNENSELDLKKKNMALESMRDLLKESLTYGHQLSQSRITSEDIPEFAKVALKEPELVRYLFDLRVNILPALVVSYLSEVSADDLWKRWSTRASVVMKSWTARTENLNELQLQEYVRWLSWANADVEFLKSIGMHPRRDKMLIRTLQNMQFIEEKSISSGSAANSTKQRALNGLRSELERYLKNVN
ncbi:MAG: coiled-coil domain-containing protein [Silvanigrellaceae bacterium]